MIFNELRNRSISVCSLDQANNKAMAAKVAGIQPQSMRNWIARPINSLEQPEKCLVQAVGVQAVFLDVRVLMRHSRFLSGEVVGQASLVVKHDLSHKPQSHQDFFCKSTKRVNGVGCHQHKIIAWREIPRLSNQARIHAAPSPRTSNRARR